MACAVVREVVRRGACAPECFRTLVIDRGGSSQARQKAVGFIRRGGEWWRFRNPPRERGDRRITVGTRTLGACAATGMPRATRFPVRWRPTPVRTAAGTAF
ncbi:protein of unknown function [Streptomyces sp. KY75]|nr:protein of unknown function [Streptomyces sp. KY70]CAD5987300.1 protein of unknown function [Streptomyces sp. KY75]